MRELVMMPDDTLNEEFIAGLNLGADATSEELATEVTRLLTVYNALEYSRLRKAKYDLLNQFELMTDDAANGTTTHAEAIDAIKAAHPKPE